MQNLTIRGGNLPGDNQGGGIRNNGGTLALTSVVLINNHSEFGGGIYNNSVTMTIVNSAARGFAAVWP